MKKNHIPKLAALVVLVISAFGPTSETALAQGPPEDYTYTNVYGAGEACSFPVRVEVSGREKVILLPGGRLMVASPGLTATFTNLDDPSKQSTQVITGAIHVTFNEDGSVELVLTGRSFLEGFDPELPTLAITIGRLSLAIDEMGNFIRPPSGYAKVINVCSLID